MSVIDIARFERAKKVKLINYLLINHRALQTLKCTSKGVDRQ